MGSGGEVREDGVKAGTAWVCVAFSCPNFGTPAGPSDEEVLQTFERVIDTWGPVLERCDGFRAVHGEIELVRSIADHLAMYGSDHCHTIVVFQMPSMRPWMWGRALTANAQLVQAKADLTLEPLDSPAHTH